MTEEPKDGGPAFPHSKYMKHEVTGAFDTYAHGGMSLRAYAAIKLCVPDSGIDWLDSMIRTSLRDRFAGQALSVVATSTEGSTRGQGPLSQPAQLREPRAIAFDAYALADAMLVHHSQPSGTTEDEA